MIEETISLENLRLMPNHVLVKTNEDHETYQLNGRDTNIRNPLSVGTAGQRLDVVATVMKVPDTLTFKGKDIKHARNYYASWEYQKYVDLHKRNSVSFDVPIEIKEGDEVMYFYKNQLDGYKNGLVFYTDEGTLMLMKYDSLRAVVLGENSLYPLNGRVFIEQVELKSEHKTDSGIELLEQKHMGMKFKRKVAIGRVVEVGAFCNGYLDFLELGKDDRNLILQPGDYVYYDARMSNYLQFDLHQTLKTKRLMLHRKDIYQKVEDPSKFDFAE